MSHIAVLLMENLGETIALKIKSMHC